MDHSELIQEMVLLEKMTAQERLKHARRRRQQQLKNWMQREGLTSNGTTVSNGLSTKLRKTAVKFPENVVILEGKRKRMKFSGKLRRFVGYFQPQHGKTSRKFVIYFNQANTVQIPQTKTV